MLYLCIWIVEIERKLFIDERKRFFSKNRTENRLQTKIKQNQ